MTYNPHPKSQEILKYAMKKIQSVPYNVSARWVFYQLVQAGIIRKKEIKRFDALLSRARKSFWNGWKPDILKDTIRKCCFKGENYVYFDLGLDSIRYQDCYVQIWFEAEAMHGQFEYYMKEYRTSLIPFRGDCSIPIKWEIAKKLEAMATKYAKPIKILYFGDYDEKGLQIYHSALKDIKAWCNVEFDVERVGLTLEQADRLNIPDNPLKPHTYQWEALNDEQAGNLIVNALEQHQQKISSSHQKRESEIRDEIIDKINEVLQDCEAWKT